MRTVWFALALLGLTYGVEVNNDGTPVDVGGDGSIWSTKDKDGEKIKFGVNCYKNDSNDDVFHMVLRAYNEDQARQDDGSDPYFKFTQCQALQRDQIGVNLQREANPKCPFTQSGTNGSHFELDHIVDTGAAAMTCGIELDGTKYKFAIRCQKDGGYLQYYDRIVLGHCDYDVVSSVLVATVDSVILVGEVAKEKINRRYKVKMGFVKKETAPDPALDVLLDTNAVSLSDPLFITWIFSINSDAGADDTRALFDKDFGPMGLRISKCTAKRHADQQFDANEGADNDPGANGVDIIVDGCGVSTPVSQQSQGQRPKWIKKSTDGDNAYFMSPNHWYFGVFDAVMFLTETLGAGTYKTTVICEIAPATSETETAVFGDVSAANAGQMDSPGYDACTKRRRRSIYSESFNNITDFPTQVSADLTVVVTEEDVQRRHDKPRCIENTTFYTLTGILSALLLIVLAIGGYLTLKLRRAMNDRERDDSSVNGIPNKAYY